MARSANGYQVVPTPGGVYCVRFRLAGKRHMVSTGERDSLRARERAARIYTDAITGAKPPPTRAKAKPDTTSLKELMLLWLEDYEAGQSGSGGKVYRIYVSAHWLPFFKTLDGITTSSLADYATARLRVVVKATVRKELSGLRGFLRWLDTKTGEKSGHVFPTIGKKVTGTRRRPKRNIPDLTTGEVARLLGVMPETMTSKKTKATSWVRPYFTVAWETGLRPATLAALSVPTHYQKGQAELVITDEIDKARYGRTVPLTDEARAALDAVVPKSGVIFGQHDYRSALTRAANVAGITRLVPYDLRHARATTLLEETGNLPGVAYVLGHKQITTTNRYSQPSKRAAADVLSVSASKKKKPTLG